MKQNKKLARKVSLTLEDAIARPRTQGSLALRRRSDEEIERAAAQDPDAPLLTATQLTGGQSVMPEG